MAYPIDNILDKKKLQALIKNCKTEEDLFGEGGPVKQFMKQLLETALEAELSEHLADAKTDDYFNGNKRNGYTKKTVSCDSGPVELDIPRDRAGEFEPMIVKKHRRRLAGLDSKIIAMYARGASTRDIQAQLKELYDVDISPTLISQVTDAVLDDVKAWRIARLTQSILSFISMR